MTTRALTQVVHLLTGFSFTDLGEQRWNVAAYFDRGEAEAHLKALEKMIASVSEEDLFADESDRLQELLQASGLDPEAEVGVRIEYDLVELHVRECSPEPSSAVSVGPRSRSSALSEVTQ